jgi:hypothetical protein
MRSASSGNGLPGGMKRSSISGSCRKGSKSSKLAMRGNLGTAILMRPPTGGAEPFCSTTASSAGRRAAAESQGTSPKSRQPVRSAMILRPASNSAGSPRNLLMMKPRTIAASSASSTA